MPRCARPASSSKRPARPAATLHSRGPTWPGPGQRPGGARPHGYAMISAPVAGTLIASQRRGRRRGPAGQGADDAVAGRGARSWCVEIDEKNLRLLRARPEGTGLGRRLSAAAIRGRAGVHQSRRQRADRGGGGEARRALTAGGTAAGHDGVGRHRDGATAESAAGADRAPCTMPMARHPGCCGSKGPRLRRPVRLGLRSGGFAEVLDGLGEGECHAPAARRSRRRTRARRLPRRRRLSASTRAMFKRWLPFEWIVAIRFLREGRLQTVFIIAGVAIGVGVIVFMSALMAGLQSNFIRRVLSAQAHIQLLPPQEVARPLRQGGNAARRRSRRRDRAAAAAAPEVDRPVAGGRRADPGDARREGGGAGGRRVGAGRARQRQPRDHA